MNALAQEEPDIRQLLEVMVNLGASDLHITVGSPPTYRIDGDLRPVNAPPVAPGQAGAMMKELTPPAKRQQYEEQGTADFSFAIHGVGRYRVNLYHQRGSVCMAVRLVNNRILSIEELGLPPVVRRIADHHHGLVLVTGMTGSGKSSTLAAMIEHINDTRRAHIITVEDPIEFLHTHNKSLVNQIELGVDIADPRIALKQVLRHDPDVIMYGELRDTDAIRAALDAAEIGHLVLASMHTADATNTLTRIVNLFEMEGERVILQELSTHLRAIISQRLVRRADGKGRVVAYEILRNTPAISDLIEAGRFAEVIPTMYEGQDNMVLFHHCLARLVREEKVSLDEALQYVDDEAAFRRDVEGGDGDGETAAVGE